MQVQSYYQQFVPKTNYGQGIPYVGGMMGQQSISMSQPMFGAPNFMGMRGAPGGPAFQPMPINAQFGGMIPSGFSSSGMMQPGQGPINSQMAPPPGMMWRGPASGQIPPHIAAQFAAHAAAMQASKGGQIPRQMIQAPGIQYLQEGPGQNFKQILPNPAQGQPIEYQTRQSELKEDGNKEDENATFHPAITAEGWASEGRLKIVEMNNREYIERLKDEMKLQAEKAQLAQMQANADELDECTFHPRIRHAPNYITKIAHSLQLAKLQ